MKPRDALTKGAFGYALAAATLALLGGCATAPAGTAQTAAAPATAVTTDPWENFNRKVFAFNEALDSAVLKPVAQAYSDFVPQLVRTGVDNVLGNFYDIWSTANHFLQFKLQSGLEMGMRVLANSFFGLGGLLDPATEMRLVKRPEDFGQTLGRWGLGNGPYVVLPLFGPSTVRDATGLVFDRYASPAGLAETWTGRLAVDGVELVNLRTKLLSTSKLLDQVALDKYSFVRDAYLAQRRDAVHDGAPPLDIFNDDGADAPVKPAAPAAPASAASSAAAPPRR